MWKYFHTGGDRAGVKECRRVKVPLRVLVWSDFTEPSAVYPTGIHGGLAWSLQRRGIDARAASIDDAGQGLTRDTVAATDVLVWWGHARHSEVADEAVRRVVRRVKEKGMGFVALHSAHFSKPFQRLLDCTAGLGGWRENGDVEKIWTVQPAHPIARGVPRPLIIDREEMCAEPFDVPPPDELVFISAFPGGEAFRSGACWKRGKGRIFYFRPGHEEYPTLHKEGVVTVIYNAILWAGQLT